jgi:hypothetical protein
MSWRTFRIDTTPFRSCGACLTRRLPGSAGSTTVGINQFWVPLPSTSLVANIDAFTMREGVLNSSTGDGTVRCQQIRGLFGYLAAHGGMAITEYRHQGGSSVYGDGASCDDGTVLLGGITSTREGQFPTWEWIFNQLSLGRGVAMSFGYYDVDGTRTGGHMVRVWGAMRFNGKDYLFTLDDSEQGPNTTGLRTQQWEVADTGSPGQPGVPDGQLNLGGTLWEIEFAISAAPKPGLMIP